MSNTFGKIFCITTWGESHGKAMGVVIDGCPAGLPLSEGDIQVELDRRKPGQSVLTSARKESDTAEILSGVFDGKTLGTPISIMVRNRDARSVHYEKLKNVYRPGHADFTWEAKFGVRDWRGGGRASARETVARVAAGAVAKKILLGVGVEIVGYVIQISKLKIQNQKPQLKTQNLESFRQKIEKSLVRCPNEEKSKKMIEEIEKVRREGDSVGGVVEVVALGVPAGLGEPVFHKLSADIAGALMSIPAVKGVEIGSGFAAAGMRGSENNDIFQKVSPPYEGGVRGGLITKTNNAGGILGGISNGMPIVARAAFKPASSIAKEQDTIDNTGKKTKISVHGRHDPCVVPRAVPIVEAMLALVLVDHWLRSKTNHL